MFQRYEDKVRRRIFSLFCTVIDTNVKHNITEPQKITENFISEIQNKNLESWKSLREFIDSKYFYDECIKYAANKIVEYKNRYKETTERGKITDGQVAYLAILIERGLKHKDYKIRMAAIEEQKKLLTLLSKGSASHYINSFKGILGYNKKDIV